MYDDTTRWTDRIVSSSGEWSGNIYDFYFRVYNKLIQDIKVPFKIENGVRVDDTLVHVALREALANCLINADYYGRQGLVIIKKKNEIVLSNPGGFRVDIDEAKSGGISDPRNYTLMKMFNLIDIGERAGSGIPNIYNVWEKQGWTAPVITEAFEPDRITLSLNIKKASDKKQAIKTSDKGTTKKYKEIIIAYLTSEIMANCKEISALTGISMPRTRAILSEMIKDETIVAQGANRNRTYKLKS